MTDFFFSLSRSAFILSPKNIYHAHSHTFLIHFTKNHLRLYLSRHHNVPFPLLFSNKKKMPALFYSRKKGCIEESPFRGSDLTYAGRTQSFPLCTCCLPTHSKGHRFNFLSFPHPSLPPPTPHNEDFDYRRCHRWHRRHRYHWIRPLL